MGFFADVGPMQIFVSIHLIPPDLKFYPDANPPNYSNEEQVIEKGAMVRIKIMGLRMEVKDIVHSHSFLTLGLMSSSQSVRLKKITLVFFDCVFVVLVVVVGFVMGCWFVFSVEDTPPTFVFYLFALPAKLVSSFYSYYSVFLFSCVCCY
jgi:S1 RNA binding domain